MIGLTSTTSNKTARQRKRLRHMLSSSTSLPRWRHAKPVDISLAGRLCRDVGAALCSVTSLGLMSLGFGAPSALALPQDAAIEDGEAELVYGEDSLDIYQNSESLVINWSDFSIDAGESVTIHGLDSWRSLHRSEIEMMIDGGLFSSGTVVLVSPMGINFGSTAQVDVGNLIATTTNILTSNFSEGNLTFDQPSAAPGTRITVEEGALISVAETGYAALVAPNVGVNGLITARLGTVALGGGEIFTIDPHGDGLLTFRLPDDGPLRDRYQVSLGESGQIVAEGGVVVLSAQRLEGMVESVINSQGRIKATGVQTRNGKVVFTADTVTVAGNVDVSGTEPGQSGGTVLVDAREVTVAEDAQIDASGDAAGGQILIGATTPPLPRARPTLADLPEDPAPAPAPAPETEPSEGREPTVESEPLLDIPPPPPPLSKPEAPLLIASEEAAQEAVAALPQPPLPKPETVSIQRGAVLTADTLDDAAAADPAQGGLIAVEAARLAAVDGTLSARGGTVQIASDQDAILDGAALTAQAVQIMADADASASKDGLGGDALLTDVSIDVSSGDSAMVGGIVQVLGHRVGLFGQTALDASGGAGGGSIQIGGDYQGGGDLMRAARTYVGDDVTLSADALDQGDGGTVVVWSDDLTRFTGTISATGGAISGDGGLAEVSSKGHLDFSGLADLRATAGDKGSLLLDPKDIDIIGGGGAGIGDVDAFADNPTGASSIDPGTIAAQLDLSDVHLQANNDITVSSTIDSSINANTHSLTLEAGRAIWVNADMFIRGNVDLIANSANAQAVNRDVGAGGINIAASTQISTSTVSGDISLLVDTGPGGAEAGTIWLGDASGLVTGSGTVSLTNLGNTFGNAGIDIASDMPFTGTGATLTTAGSEVHFSNFTLVSLVPLDTVTVDTTNGGAVAAGADVAFDGPLEGGDVTDLTVDAGTDGNITIYDGTFSAGQYIDNASFTGGNITVSMGFNAIGDITLDATGDVLLDGIVEVLGTNKNLEITAGGSILGSMQVINLDASGTAVALNAGGSIGSDLNPVTINASDATGRSFAASAGAPQGGEVNAINLSLDANPWTLGTVGSTTGLTATGGVEILGTNGSLSIDNSFTVDSSGLGSALDAVFIDGFDDITINAALSLDAGGVAQHALALQTFDDSGTITQTGAGSITVLNSTDGLIVLRAGDVALGGATDSITAELIDVGFTSNGMGLVIGVGAAAGGDMNIDETELLTFDATSATEGLLIGEDIFDGTIRIDLGAFTFDDSVAFTTTTGIGSTELQSDITSAGTGFMFHGDVTLTGNPTITTNNGNAAFAGYVDATTPGTDSLTVNAGTGMVSFSDEVGWNNGLGGLSVTAGGARFGNQSNGGAMSVNVVTQGGIIDVTAPVLLDGDVTFDSTEMGMAMAGADISLGDVESTAGQFNLLIIDAGTAGTATLGTIGQTEALSDVSVMAGGGISVGAITLSDDLMLGGVHLGGDTTLSGDISTEDGMISIDGSLTVVGGDHTLSSNLTGTGTATINVDGSIEADTDNTRTLTFDAGTGDVEINGDVGAVQRLARLDVTGSILRLGDGGGSAALSLGSGGLALDGHLELWNDSHTLTTENAAVSITGAINGMAPSSSNLTVNAGTGSVAVGGSIGNSNALADLDLTGSSLDVGDIQTQGDILLNGPIVLNRNGSWDAGGMGVIQINGTVDGDGVLARTLDIWNATQIQINADLGMTEALGAVSVNSAPTQLGGDIRTNQGMVTLGSAVTLTADAMIDTTNGTGTAGAGITLNSTVDGAFDLTLEAGTGNTVDYHNPIGSVTALTGFTAHAQSLTGTFDITSSGNIDIHTVNDFDLNRNLISTGTSANFIRIETDGRIRDSMGSTTSLQRSGGAGVVLVSAGAIGEDFQPVFIQGDGAVAATAGGLPPGGTIGIHLDFYGSNPTIGTVNGVSGLTSASGGIRLDNITDITIDNAISADLSNDASLDIDMYGVEIAAAGTITLNSNIHMDGSNALIDPDVHGIQLASTAAGGNFVLGAGGSITTTGSRTDLVFGVMGMDLASGAVDSLSAGRIIIGPSMMANTNIGVGDLAGAGVDVHLTDAELLRFNPTDADPTRAVLQIGDAMGGMANNVQVAMDSANSTDQSLVFYDTGPTVLMGHLRTSGDITFASQVEVEAASTVEAGGGGGEVIFQQSVDDDAAAGVSSLTLSAGDVAFEQNVGINNALGGLDTGMATVRLGEGMGGAFEIRTEGSTITMAGTVELFDSTTLTSDWGAAAGADITLGTVEADQATNTWNLDIQAGTAGVVTIANSGLTEQINTLTINAAESVLTGTITTQGDQTYRSDVTLSGSLSVTNAGWVELGEIAMGDSITIAGNSVIDTSTSGGSVNFHGAVEANTGDTHSLTIDAGGSTANFEGSVGATNTLNSLDVTASQVTWGIGGSTLAVGSGGMVLPDILLNTDITLQSNNSAIDVGNINGSYNVALNAGTGAVSVANIGNSMSVQNLSVTGSTINLNGTTIRSNGVNGIAFTGAVVLQTDVTVEETDGNADVTFSGTIDSASAGAYGLTVTDMMGTGTTTFGDAIGTTGALSQFSQNGNGRAVTLSGDITTQNGDISLFGDVTVTSATTTLYTGAGAGTLTLNGPIGGNSAGSNALVLDAGSGDLNINGGLGSGGAGAALGAVDATGANMVLQSDVVTEGGAVSITATNPVNIMGPGTLIDTTNGGTAPAGAGVTIGATINSPNWIDITAGAGNVDLSGADITLDDFSVTTTGTLTLPTNLVISNNLGLTGTLILASSATFSAGTVTLGGTIDAAAAGGAGLDVASTSGDVTLTGTLGGTNALQSFSVNTGGFNLNLGADITTQGSAINLSGASTTLLTADTTLDTTGGGAVAAGANINLGWTEGGFALTADAGTSGGITLGGNLGSGTRLSSIDLSGGSFVQGANTVMVTGDLRIASGADLSIGGMLDSSGSNANLVSLQSDGSILNPTANAIMVQNGANVVLRAGGGIGDATNSVYINSMAGNDITVAAEAQGNSGGAESVMIHTMNADMTIGTVDGLSGVSGSDGIVELSTDGNLTVSQAVNADTMGVAGDQTALTLMAANGDVQVDAAVSLAGNTTLAANEMHRVDLDASMGTVGLGAGGSVTNTGTDMGAGIVLYGTDFMLDPGAGAGAINGHQIDVVLTTGILGIGDGGAATGDALISESTLALFDTSGGSMGTTIFSTQAPGADINVDLTGGFQLNTSVSFDTVTSGGMTHLYSDVASNGHSLEFMGHTELAAASVTVSTTGAGNYISFDAVDASMSGSNDLVVSAGASDVDFYGDIGLTNALGAVSVTTTGTVQVGDNSGPGSLITEGGAITMSAGQLILADDLTIDTTNVGAAPTGASLTLNTPIDADAEVNNRMLTLDAGSSGTVSLNGAIGSTERLWRLEVSEAASTVTTASVSTATDQIYTSDVSLGGNMITGDALLQIDGGLTVTADATLSTGAGAGAININGTIDDGTADTHTLTLDAGTGLVSLGGNVGATTRLDGFTVTSGAGVDWGGNSLDVASGGVQITPDITLNGNLVVSTASSAVNFGNIEDNAPNSHTVEINTGGADVTLNSVGDVSAVNYIQVNGGTIHLNGDMNAQGIGGIDLTGAVSLNNLLTLTTSDPGGQPISITGTVESATAGSYGLTLDAQNGGDVVVTGAIGATNALSGFNQNGGGTTTLGGGVRTQGGPVMVSGDANLGGDIVTQGGTVQVAGQTTLDGAILIDTGAGAGLVTFSGLVQGTTPGADSLQVNAGTGDVSINNGIGHDGMTPVGTMLGSVDLAGNTINLTNGIVAEGPIGVAATSAVNLNTAVIIDSTNAGNGSGGLVQVSGPVAGGANDLTIDAGTANIDLGAADITVNSFSATTTGTLTLPTTLTATNALSLTGTMLLAADATFSANTVTLGGTIDATIAGGAFLDVSATGGDLTLTGTLGGTTALSSVTASATGTTHVGADITTAGEAIDFNGGPVELIGDTTLATTGGGIMAGADIDLGTVDGAYALTADAGNSGILTLNGSIGTTTALSQIDFSGGSFIQNANPVMVEGDLRLQSLSDLTLDGMLQSSGNAANLVSLQSDGSILSAGGGIQLNDDMNVALRAGNGIGTGATPFTIFGAPARTVTLAAEALGNSDGTAAIALTTTSAAMTIDTVDGLSGVSGGDGSVTLQSDDTLTVSQAVSADTTSIAGDVTGIGLLSTTGDVSIQAAVNLTGSTSLGAAESHNIDVDANAGVVSLGASGSLSADASDMGAGILLNGTDYILDPAAGAGAVSAHWISINQNSGDLGIGDGGSATGTGTLSEGELDLFDTSPGSQGMLMLSSFGAGANINVDLTGGYQLGTGTEFYADSGTTRLYSDVSSSGDLSFTGMTELYAASISLDTSGALLSLGEVQAATPGNDLSLSAASGNIELLNNMGTTGALGTVSITAGSTITTGEGAPATMHFLQTQGEAVTFSAGTLLLAGSLTVDTTNVGANPAGAAITVNPTVEADDVLENRELILNSGSGGAVTLAGTSSDGATQLGGVSLTGGSATVANVYTSGVQTYNAPTTASGTLFSGAGGGITFSSDATISGPILTESAVVTFGGNTVLSGNANIDTTNSGAAAGGANVNFIGTINGSAPDSQSLSVNGGITGVVMLNGAVGDSTPLAGLSITEAGGGVNLNGGTITLGSNGLDVQATATLGSNTVITATGVDLNNVNGVGFDLSIDSGSGGINLGAGNGLNTLALTSGGIGSQIGETGPVSTAGAFTVTGNARIMDDVTAGGAFTVTGDMDVQDMTDQSVTITGDTIDLQGNVSDSTTDTNSLTLSSTTQTTLGGNVSGLNSLDVSGGPLATSGNIGVQSGSLTLNSPVTLTGGSSALTSNGGTITVGNTIDSSVGSSLSINGGAGGTVDINGALGTAGNELGGVSIDGTTVNLNTPAIRTNGPGSSINIDGTTVNHNTALSLLTGGGNVHLQGTHNVDNALTVTSGGGNVLIEGTTNNTASISVTSGGGNIGFLSTKNLNAAVTLDGGAGSNISIGGTTTINGGGSLSALSDGSGSILVTGTQTLNGGSLSLDGGIIGAGINISGTTNVNAGSSLVAQSTGGVVSLGSSMTLTGGSASVSANGGGTVNVGSVTMSGGETLTVSATEGQVNIGGFINAPGGSLDIGLGTTGIARGYTTGDATASHFDVGSLTVTGGAEALLVGTVAGNTGAAAAAAATSMPDAPTHAVSWFTQSGTPVPPPFSTAPDQPPIDPENIPDQALPPAEPGQGPGGEIGPGILGGSGGAKGIGGGPDIGGDPGSGDGPGSGGPEEGNTEGDNNEDQPPADEPGPGQAPVADAPGATGPGTGGAEPPGAPQTGGAPSIASGDPLMGGAPPPPPPPPVIRDSQGQLAQGAEQLPPSQGGLVTSVLDFLNDLKGRDNAGGGRTGPYAQPTALSNNPPLSYSPNGTDLGAEDDNGDNGGDDDGFEPAFGSFGFN